MEYNIGASGDNIVVEISGRLTFAEHDACRSIIKELSAMSGNSQVIDLSKVEFIDSAGLGLLLLLRENAEKKNSSISMRVPQDGQVQRMLEVARFNDLIPIEK